MINSSEATQSQPNQNPDLSPPILPASDKDQEDYFSFLKAKESSSTSSSFFSKNGLSQDIIQVTEAEPDICLEVFYALYNVLWPQIEKQSSTSLKDAWKNFIGRSTSKGILYPPERLIGKRINDIKKAQPGNRGENYVFQDLDTVVKLIQDLKKQLDDHAGEIFQKPEIMESLSLIEAFYTGFRAKVKDLVITILEKGRLNESSLSQINELDDLLESKAVMMSDIFPHHWAYRISRSKAQKLLSLDWEGNPVQNYSSDHSIHRVAALPEKSEAPEPLVYFKANGGTPIQPEKEFMLYSLYRHLNIPVPETALLILTNVFLENSNYYYAVQASEAVNGKPSLEAYQSKETFFEEEAYVLQVIGALLTNPFDGSLKNFKYSPKYKTFISIDNDLIFGPELMENDGKIINVKSLLYVLPEMDHPIPASVQTYFTTLDPHSMILNWLHDLERKNKEYKFLFSRLSYQYARYKYQCLRPHNEPPSLTELVQKKIKVDPELHQSSFRPQIRLSKNLLNSIPGKLQKIEKRFHRSYSASPQTLFEEISPILGTYYKKLRLQLKDPKEGLEALWGEKQGSVKYPCVHSLLAADEVNILIEKKDTLEEEHAPEELFAEYKKVLISEKTSLDKLIRRHSERKMKGVLDLQQVLKDLQMLIQEGLTESKSFREVVDFWHDLSQTSGNNTIIEEARSLLFSLPHVELNWLFTLEKYFLRRESPPVDKPLPAVLGAFLRKRTLSLTESENNYLFDEEGNIRKNTSLTGRSKVTFFPENKPEFYLKQYPEWPGYEFASTLFMRLLGVQHLPYQDLLIMDKNSFRYPVLLTQKVEGRPVLKIWNEADSFKNLDPFHTGLLIISAMLLNPEDGKEDNYILHANGRFIIPIDNDHCFLPSTFQQDAKFWKPWTVNTAIQTKTLLFCLDEMDKSIPIEVRDHILSLDFDLLLTSWMKELIKTEDRYNNLVGQEHKSDFVDHGTVLRIPFDEQFIHNLYWKVHKIQDLLRSPSDLKPFDLLQALEPFAAGWYQDSFKNGDTLEKRFKAATKHLYTKINDVDGSRVSIMDTRSMMNIIHISEADLKNDLMYSKTGPSDALELFRRLMGERSKKREMEQEFLRELDRDEESLWEYLFGNRISEAALKDFFKDPKESLALKSSNLIESKRLTSLFALSSDKGTTIRFLSLPDSPLLDKTTIRTLVEGCHNLEYLNVSGCVKLNEIVTGPGEWPELVRIEAKECPTLEKVVCESPIQILRIGTLQKVEICIEKSSVDVFELSIGSSQFDFIFKKEQGFGIRSLKKKNCIGEEGLGVYFKDSKMKLGKYSISSVESFRVLISFIDIRPCEIHPRILEEFVELGLINLKRLVLSDDPLSRVPLNRASFANASFASFFITNSPNEGQIFQEKLSILALGKWPLLEELDLSNAGISDIQTLTILTKARWPRLRGINLSNSPISDEGLSILSQGRWLLLETLNLRDTAVTTTGVLDLLSHARWPNIKEISFSTSEEVSHLLPSSLEKIDLRNSDILHFEVGEIVRRAKWLKLKHLDISNNPIYDAGLAGLSQGEWSQLETLNLSFTNVSTKGVMRLLLQASWPNLKEIIFAPYDKIDQDQIQHLFPTNPMPLLKVLDLSNTQVMPKIIEIIVKRPISLQLKCLNLSANDLSDEGFSLLNLGEWPMLEEIHLQNTKITQKGIEVIAKRSKWPQIKHLNICDNLINEEGFAMLSYGKWPLLEQLQIQKTGMTSKGIEAIVKKPQWFKLKHLDISFNPITDEGIETLSQGNWPLLERLYAHHIEITSKGVEALVKGSKWPELKHLNLSYNEIGTEGFSSLTLGGWPLLRELILNNAKISNMSTANGGKLAQLKHLDLSFNQISDEGLAELSEGTWPLLETINLRWTNVTTKGLLYLLLVMNWCHLKEVIFQFSSKFQEELVKKLLPTNLHLLEKLDLVNTKISHIEIAAIVNQSKYQRLRSLDLSDNDISDRGFSILALGELPILEELNLRNTNMTLKGIELIVKISKWPQLKSLNISKNVITEKGFEMLATGEWPLLEELSMWSTSLSAKGIESIAKQSKWSKLKKLDISGNAIFDEGLKVLAFATQWLLMENLIFYDTEITLNGFLIFLENVNWPNLKILENLSLEKFLTDSGEPFSSETSSISKVAETKIALRPITSDQRYTLVVLNIKWSTSEAICISLNEHDRSEKTKIMPLGKWNQQEYLNLSLPLLPNEGLVSPPYLKVLDISRNHLDSQTLQTLFSMEYPQLEELNLRDTRVKAPEIKTIISLSKLPKLKKLKIADNPFSDEGIKFLASGQWPLLEYLDLHNTCVTDEGVEYMIDKADWPYLKILDISMNRIISEEIEDLIAEIWPLLKKLFLDPPKILDF